MLFRSSTTQVASGKQQFIDTFHCWSSIFNLLALPEISGVTGIKAAYFKFMYASTFNVSLFDRNAGSESLITDYDYDYNESQMLINDH